MPEPVKKFFFKDDTTNDVIYGVVKWDAAPPDSDYSDQIVEIPYDGTDIIDIKMTAKSINWNELNSYTEVSAQDFSGMFGEVVSAPFILGGVPRKPTT